MTSHLIDSAEDKRFNIAVVPEHFSLPFQLGKGRGIFAKHNVEVTTIDHPKGTGSMTRALRTGEVDVAVALTEGIVADLVNVGPAFKIIATYVQSPLHWGAFVHPDSSIRSLDGLKGKTFGISRPGSGSQIMPFVLGNNLRWDEQDVQFSVKGGIADLIGGIQDHSTDVFLWETFTTKPYADQGLVKEIGQVISPWPCFVVVARNDILKSSPNAMKRLLAAIHESTSEFMKTDNSLKYISRESKLSLEDSKSWFDQVEFSDGKVSRKVLNNVVSILHKSRVIQTPDVNISDLVDSNVTQLCS